jgi:hypothetical protein
VPNATDPLRPTPVLGFGPVRLRTLSEAECYARIYGGPGEGRVSIVRVGDREATRTSAGERLRELFEERLDLRGLEDEAA